MSWNFGLKSYLWFQIELARILKSRVWFQTKLYSTQFNYHYFFIFLFVYLFIGWSKLQARIIEGRVCETRQMNCSTSLNFFVFFGVFWLSTLRWSNWSLNRTDLVQYDLTAMLCQNKNYQEELLKELWYILYSCYKRVSLYYTISQDRTKIAVKSIWNVYIGE